MRPLKPYAAYKERQHTGGIKTKQQFGQTKLSSHVGQNNITRSNKAYASGIRFAAHMRDRHVGTRRQAQPQVVHRPWTVIALVAFPGCAGDGLEIGAKAKYFR